MRRYLLIIVAVLLALNALAQSNRIYIEDFELDADSTRVVPVMLANSDPTRGFQFNMKLPKGLKMMDCEATAYAIDYEMTVTANYNAADSSYLVFMYPTVRICLPSDTVEVILLTFEAASDFRGGEIAIWKCMGSTIDNETIYMDGSTTTVTVPASTLIGIPIDQQPRDQYFNLMGQPIASPDSAPVAIQVTTGADGERSSRKIATAH
ncbi:MAG: hypothetical protein IKW85_09755 [Muribaculaceae bacterium]|nr:hypothetical protein [Muribaculaceae bacterium]